MNIKKDNQENILLIIIGKKSNLSQQLNKQYQNTILISSQDVIYNIKILEEFRDKKTIFLFNNFQTAKLLNNIDNIEEYVNRSILVTAKVLDYIKSFTLIEKIIYTSSSSVYGDNKFCSEQHVPHPINLQASIKLSNEFFIKQFCKEQSIDYTILRIFNMYGGDDNFSVVSKIINAAISKNTLTLINNGQGIRDFIHIDDVVYIILRILLLKNINILNIGTGEKKSIKNILDYLKQNNIPIATQNLINSSEIKVSIANPENLLKLIDKKFIQVEEYILNEIRKRTILG